MTARASSDHLRRERELAEGRAGERGRRVERDVADQLEPELAADASARPGTSGRPRRTPRRSRRQRSLDAAVRLADREARALDVPDDAGLDELGRRIRDAADDARRLDRPRDDAAGVDASRSDRALAARPPKRLEEPPGHAVLRRQDGGVGTSSAREPRRELGEAVGLERR